VSNRLTVRRLLENAPASDNPLGLDQSFFCLVSCGTQGVGVARWNGPLQCYHSHGTEIH
jgi:hypothetical protein